MPAEVTSDPLDTVLLADALPGYPRFWSVALVALSIDTTL
jgi:hypothetical protein